MPLRYRDALLVTLVIGVLAFNYPLLAVFDRPLAVLGTPLLVVYLYGFWLVVIIAVALIMRACARSKRSDD